MLHVGRTLLVVYRNGEALFELLRRQSKPKGSWPPIIFAQTHPIATIECYDISRRGLHRDRSNRAIRHTHKSRTAHLLATIAAKFDALHADILAIELQFEKTHYTPKPQHIILIVRYCHHRCAIVAKRIWRIALQRRQHHPDIAIGGRYRIFVIGIYAIAIA